MTKLDKRALLPILALLCAALSGCEGVVPTRTQLTPPIELTDLTEPEPENVVAAPSWEDEEDPYAGFAQFPEGDYFKSPKFATDEYLPEYDYDTNYNPYIISGPGVEAARSTDTTVYGVIGRTLGMHGINGYLWYCDKATGIWGPLCSKPECTHTDKTCGAYIGDAPGFCLYDGRLYWSGKCMDLDGMGRKSGPWSANMTNISSAVSSNIVFHRGYVFSCGNWQTIVDGRETFRLTVNATDMDSGEQFTIYDRIFWDYSNINVVPAGRSLYIQVYTITSGTEDRNDCLMRIYRWDIGTRQPELVLRYDDRGQDLRIEELRFLPVPGDGIYLGCWYDSRRDELWPSRYDFETGELTQLFPLARGKGVNENVYYTRDYVITSGCTGERTAEEDSREYFWDVYDYAGNLAAHTASRGYHGGDFIGTDGAYIFGLCSSCYFWHDAPGHFTLTPLDGGPAIMMGLKEAAS